MCFISSRQHWSWTPSSPLPWNLAFRLTRFSKYYSSLQSISAIYHNLLAHLHKKTSLHHQNRRRTDTEEQFKRARGKKRGTHARKIAVAWSASNFNNTSLNLLNKDDRGNHLSLLERIRFTFTPNGRREFVPRDQVSPLFFAYSLLVLRKNE